MKIEVGMQFTIHGFIYTIFSINEEKVKIEHEGYVIRAIFYLDDVIQNIENKIWIPVEQIEVKRDELIEHELLDRASIISNMFEQYISAPANNYPLVRESKMWDIITRINGDLYELYQELGNLDDEIQNTV